MSYIGILTIASAVCFLLGSKRKNIVYLDDQSNTNSCIIDSIVYPKSFDELQELITSYPKLCVSGNRYSLGGQSLLKNGVIINMLSMNNILKLNKSKKTITVQSGLLWSDLMMYLNKYGLSPMIIPSHLQHTIGGSISINSHSISKSIVELKIILSDGQLYICSRTNNSKLFSLIIGGFGLFGIIYEVTLQVVSNIDLSLITQSLTIDSFVDYIISCKSLFQRSFVNLSSFNDINHHSFRSKNIPVISSFNDNKVTNVNELYNNISIPKSDNKDNTSYTTQQYSIPIYNFKEWMIIVKTIFEKHNDKHCILQNIMINLVSYDDVVFLKYITQDTMLSFTFDYKIINNTVGDSLLKTFNMKLIDACNTLGGTFHLLSKCHYTKEQLIKSYPNIIDFIKYKEHLDKKCMFSNNWFEYILSFTKL